MSDIESIIRARLLETGKTLPEKKIAELVSQIERAGTQTLAFVGDAAVNAEANQANYSPSQHLRAITGGAA